MLGGRDGVSAGHVHHDDPASCGSLQVHVVHTGAGAADHGESGRRIDHPGRHVRLASHDERGVLADDSLELVSRQTRAIIDREILDQGKRIQRTLGDLVAYQHLCHAANPVSRSMVFRRPVMSAGVSSPRWAIRNAFPLRSPYPLLISIPSPRSPAISFATSIPVVLATHVRVSEAWASSANRPNRSFAQARVILPIS